MTTIEAARTYHEITKHSYTSVRSGAYPLDWDNKPAPYKIYPEAGSMALPRDLDLPAIADARGDFIRNRRHRCARYRQSDADLLLRQWSDAAGKSRWRGLSFSRGSIGGSALSDRNLHRGFRYRGLEAGLYHFSPADLKLRGLRRGDWREVIKHATAMRPSIANARAIIIMSAIFGEARGNIGRVPIGTASGMQARSSRICSRPQLPKESVPRS